MPPRCNPHLLERTSRVHMWVCAQGARCSQPVPGCCVWMEGVCWERGSLGTLKAGDVSGETQDVPWLRPPSWPKGTPHASPHIVMAGTCTHAARRPSFKRAQKEA